MSTRITATVIMSRSEHRRMQAQAENAVRANKRAASAEADNRRLRAAAANAASRSAEMDNRMNQLTRQAENDRRMTAAMRDAIQEANNSTARVHRAMQEQQKQTDTSLAKINIQITENEKQMRAEMDAVKRNLLHTEQQVQCVKARLDGMDTQNDTLLQMAEEYLHGASMVLKDIRKNFPAYEKLVPDRMSKVVQSAQNAQEQLILSEKIPANSATARADARNAFAEALTFREEVIHAEEVWNARQQAAEHALTSAEQTMQSSRCIPVEIHGNTVTCPVETWSNGDLSRLYNRLIALRDSAEEAQQPDDFEMIQAASEQLEKDVLETAVFASEAMKLSQQRVENIADIADRLEELGLSVREENGYGFAGGDQRSAYRLIVENKVIGFAMAVTMTPQVSQDGSIQNGMETDILRYGSNSAEEGCKLAKTVVATIRGDSSMEIVEEGDYRRTPSSHSKSAEDMQCFLKAKSAVPQPTHHKEDGVVHAAACN